MHRSALRASSGGGGGVVMVMVMVMVVVMGPLMLHVTLSKLCPDLALLFLPRVHFSRLWGRAKQIDQTSQSVGRIPTLVGFFGPSFPFLRFWF